MTVATPSSTFRLPAGDGVDLQVYRWLPAGTAKGAVQIAHGLAEHAARYGRLAEALNASGYAVYAHDQRGHGGTAKSRSELGFLGERDGWRKCIDDLWLVNRRLAADYPGLPVLLLGHSMGSAMAHQFITEHGDAVAGAALSGSSGTPTAMGKLGRGIARLERAHMGPRGRSAVIKALTFTAFNKPFAPARTDFDWLSRDPAEVDKYVADPLCGFSATVQLWVDLLDAAAEMYKPQRLARIPKDLPIYVLAGSRDPVGAATRQVQKQLAAYHEAGLARVEYSFYEGARHEVFNETNRDEVTQELIAWMERVVAGPPAMARGRPHSDR